MVNNSNNNNTDPERGTATALSAQISPAGGVGAGASGKRPENPPFPQWYTTIARGLMAVYATVFIAYVGWLFGTYREVRTGMFIAAIISGGGAIFINYFAAVMSYLGKYGPGAYWQWVCFLDAPVASVGIWGFVASRGEPEGYGGKDLKGFTDATAFLLLVLAIFHAIASLGGIYALFVDSRRKKAENAARLAAEQEMDRYY